MGAPKATDTPAAAAADSTCKVKGQHHIKGITGCPIPAYLAALPFVLAVLGKQAAEEVSAATGHVDQRALLPQTEARRHRQDQGHRLNQQGPFPEVTADDEAAQDGLDLWKTVLLGLPLQPDRRSPHRFSPPGFLNRRRTEQTLAPVTRPGRKTAEPTGCTGSSSARTPPPPARGRRVSVTPERPGIVRRLFQRFSTSVCPVISSAHFCHCGHLSRSSNVVSLDVQQHCSWLYQNADKHTPSFRSVIQSTARSITPASVPAESPKSTFTKTQRSQHGDVG